MWSLAGRLSAVVAGLIGASVALALLLAYGLPDAPWAAGALTLLVMLPATVAVLRHQLQPLLSLFRALEGTVATYRDGDYSFGLHWPHSDELQDLVTAHNALGDVLRAQRLDLVQRELLQDTMLQNTPVAMLLVCDGGPLVYANVAARQMLHQGKKLEGHTLASLVDHVAPPLREALARGGDGLFTVTTGERGDTEAEDTFHLARRSFTLNGRPHELLLLRQLTTELRRQEVQTWKKVIRVISHELNNSLAPMASLANSGAELLRRGQPERLPEILQTIEERTRHLETFILGYARFAKLPTPRLEATPWANFLSRLQAQQSFRVAGDLPLEPGQFDRAQLEQALQNLVKNAHESGSAPADVAIAVRRLNDVFLIEVIDKGPGMSEAVLTQALVPFYSTKRSGTGLGLALAREIIEAHGGTIALNNRAGGGLLVSLTLPKRL
jgi:two-component system, NtrC family, nitrogen regulation sensor histidine kinase NtrY